MPRLIFFLSSFFLVAVIGLFAIQYAKGLRFNLRTLRFSPTGILVATSQPNGAQVLINGKLEAATNENLSLAPETYDIEITKEGYHPWKKRMSITASEVTKTDAVLFPKAPTLSPLTFDGALRAFATQDGTKLAWIVKDNENGNKTGLWIIELSNLPFGFTREARYITDADLSEATFTWSPDGREILITNGNTSFLIETGKFTRQESLVALSQTQATKVITEWDKQKTKRIAAQTKGLPQNLQDILMRKTKQFVFSPDETKILYTASASATLQENLIPPVPGSSTQKQSRDIKPDKTYVYDIKEDRNFLVTDVPNDIKIGNSISWFPTSRHILLAEPDKITLMEYDGANKTTIWSGPYEEPYAFTTPDAGQLIILTNFGSTDGSAIPNLYSINLR